MPHEYTRQRQGRDFYINNNQPRKTANNHKKAGEEKKTLADRLEHYKEEAERNSVPVDGKEPLEENKG